MKSTAGLWDGSTFPAVLKFSRPATLHDEGIAGIGQVKASPTFRNREGGSQNKGAMDPRNYIHGDSKGAVVSIGFILISPHGVTVSRVKVFNQVA